MNFVLKPSLEHIALVKVVISLWNQNDVRALITKPCSNNFFSSEEWEAIEEQLIEKVTQLSLPELLKKNVLGLIKPVGLQIKEWLLFHFVRPDPLQNLPDELCWTPQGMVDRKRTAKVLVRDENLDMSTRYRLACIYCLEDDVHQLWNSFTGDLKNSLLGTGCWYIHYWSHSMKGRGLDNADILYKHKFRLCVLCDNKVAAEYLLQKLTPAEREESLVEAGKEVDVEHVYNADFFCFLLSKMDEEQQMAVFKNSPYGLLEYFLEWPWQNFFIGVANCLWNFLSHLDYKYLLIAILRKVSDSYKDWIYQKLFKEFWQESPNALKSLITNEIDKSSLQQYFFDIEDKETIRLILKDTTLTAREKIIYSYEMNTFCKQFIRDNERDLLGFCIWECFSSKNDMLEFKGNFKNVCLRTLKSILQQKKNTNESTVSFV